jgi:MFS family permease
LAGSEDRRDVLLLITSRVSRSFAAGFLAVIIPLYYAHVLRLNSLLIAGLFAAGAFGTPALTLLFGKYADRYGRKRFLILTLTLLPIAIIILLLTSNYILLLISSALGGFGIAGGLVGGGVGASVAPMQTALLAEKTNSVNRTKIFSLFTIASSVTGSAGALASNVSDYRGLFLIALLLTLISFLSVLPLRERFTPPGKREFRKVDEESRHNIRKFIITGSLNGAGQGLIIPFLPLILNEIFHMSKGEIGDLFSAGGFITAAAMYATPYLTDRIGFVKYIMSTRAVATAFLLYFPFSGSALAASASYIIFTVLRAIALPSQQALMMNVVSEETRSYASGANQSARLFPSAAATFSPGAIQTFFNDTIPFELAFVINMVNIALYYKFFWHMPEANARAAAHTVE